MGVCRSDSKKKLEKADIDDQWPQKQLYTGNFAESSIFGPEPQRIIEVPNNPNYANFNTVNQAMCDYSANIQQNNELKGDHIVNTPKRDMMGLDSIQIERIMTGQTACAVQHVEHTDTSNFTEDV